MVQLWNVEVPFGLVSNFYSQHEIGFVELRLHQLVLLDRESVINRESLHGFKFGWDFKIEESQKIVLPQNREFEEHQIFN